MITVTVIILFMAGWLVLARLRRQRYPTRWSPEGDGQDGDGGGAERGDRSHHRHSGDFGGGHHHSGASAAGTITAGASAAGASAAGASAAGIPAGTITAERRAAHPALAPDRGQHRHHLVSSTQPTIPAAYAMAPGPAAAGGCG